MRVARDVVSDIGEAAASSSGGLRALASLDERHAERDSHRLMANQLKLSLPVPVSCLKGTAFPTLRLRDWMDFVINRNCWHVLCGLLRPDTDREQAILREFWHRFRQCHPDHEVFRLADSMQISLARTAPLLYHGDEGRGRRRTPFLVTSFHGLLGRGIRSGLQAQAKAGAPKEYTKLKPNFIGHSYTNRYLQCAMPKMAYQDDDVFAAILESASAEAEHMWKSGIQHRYTGARYWAIVLNVTGDWPWLAKAGNLARSFSHAVKSLKKLKKPPAGICHKCQAGQLEHSFECIHVRTPSWLSTLHSQSPFLDPPSPLTSFLCTKGQEADIFAYDLWHSWHLGVGKVFLGSALALLSDRFHGGSVHARFAGLNSAYFAWCREFKHAPILTRLTTSTIEWDTTTTYPKGNWFKGELTTTLGRFVRHMTSGGNNESRMLDLVGEACAAIDTCVRGLYEHDAFLPSETARELGEHGLRFLRRFATLARLCVESGWTLFLVTPKIHVLQHVFLVDLVLAADRGPWVVNPICYSVQQSEDFIGRNSRVARKVHPSQASRRCLECHLLLGYKKYCEAGLLVEARD